MERASWLREIRRAAEERWDTRYAPSYDQHEGGSIDPVHRRFVTGVVERTPPGGRVLDAACGTGRFFGIVLAAGRAVTGTDQSSGMLARAAAKHPEAVTEHVGLQELPYDAEFDAVICVDAMENVFPEDWPVVLANLRRAVRPGGEVYLTVERTPEPVLIESFAESTAQGFPVVHGEMVARGGAGYHYYPPIGQVGAWIAGAGLDVVAEEEAPGENDSYSYEHILLRRPAS